MGYWKPKTFPEKRLEYEALKLVRVTRDCYLFHNDPPCDNRSCLNCYPENRTKDNCLVVGAEPIWFRSFVQSGKSGLHFCGVYSDGRWPPTPGWWYLTDEGKQRLEEYECFGIEGVE